MIVAHITVDLTMLGNTETKEICIVCKDLADIVSYTEKKGYVIQYMNIENNCIEL